VFLFPSGVLNLSYPSEIRVSFSFGGFEPLLSAWEKEVTKKAKEQPSRRLVFSLAP
jgi:hypothetical protein